MSGVITVVILAVLALLGIVGGKRASAKATKAMEEKRRAEDQHQREIYQAALLNSQAQRRAAADEKAKAGVASRPRTGDAAADLANRLDRTGAAGGTGLGAGADSNAPARGGGNR